jgi:hypothetical protein
MFRLLAHLQSQRGHDEFDRKVMECEAQDFAKHHMVIHPRRTRAESSTLAVISLQIF